MESVWAQSVERSIHDALRTLAGAVSGCSDSIWVRPMWVVPPESGAGAPTDTAESRQRRAAPWSVAWHALECIDYDLTGEFAPWSPPAPFEGHAHWRDVERMAEPWSKTDILGYIDYCDDRTTESFRNMTESLAARLLPAAHRYAGQPHAWLITGFIGHTTEHATQIAQFVANPASGR